MLTVPCWWVDAQLCRSRRNAVVAELAPQRVERERATLVDAVVEQVLRARVAEHEVLRQGPQAGVVQGRVLLRAVGPPEASDQSHSA